ncbi:tRNA (adenosine(37)-N6)-threonylcarbamoyltransferase complex dimerization subunit type 1 TsaB [Flavobacterium aciduliphilum]|uniref:tRNA threonylcarbamoyladenosine biosynthesis protein TsaB n=1 Tax=Flavobacterium aciduliphilum TaxID=1101402 RepID=A0A328YGE3_9FLAO|nr:tRNA (adenosine(37)-N6)-threonylcarbamoyltransferase complex dimerization subunit type 1 TsaB [Flavobacterium aciduliphilum]RAR71785.1 tRNA threonylcarbamoyladenosine biosynthesis protein TsaB [Flavobacterium aciduliphilum]
MKEYILNIETATKNCSVSLSKNGVTVCCKETAEEGYAHAEKLHVFIESVLAEAQVPYSNLCAIAVSQGPGSYTGLRIGVSAAKGLSYSLQIPLIAIDTLETLVYQVKQDNGWIVPMIDARRMEVYSAVFNGKKERISPVESVILTPESFSMYSGVMYFVGDSTEKAKTVLNNPNFIFLEDTKYPSAREMSLLSYQKFLNKNFVDVAYFEPYYLKDFMIVK